MRTSSINNAMPSYTTIFIGSDKTPCVVFENFTNDLYDLIKKARSSSFKSVLKKSYPGIRSELPKDYTDQVVEYVRDIIVSVYGVPDNYHLSDYNGYFSLVTKVGSDLSFAQKIPHFDTAEPYYFAVLHYLNDAPHGGTGFFKHRPTDIERVSFESTDFYIKRAKQYIAGNGPPEGRYCWGDDHFELIEEIKYVKNRLIIYPGNVLHSGLIDESVDVSDDVDSGRLTANIFLGFDRCQ